ncbi:phage late control D family protein [Xenorhabdus sp. Vera]|nr:contractile injection system protein, VgrG/Pvc8 family [Xenorhabdus sp. Vera]MBD2812502.1 phage late control D family protein [Xenorhabdus sp. Vera]
MPRIDWITGNTNTPVYVLSAGETNINARIQNRLMSLSLTDNRGFEADQLDIELDDSDGLLSLPPRGTTLSLHLGWQGESLIHKGTFIVDELEYSSAPDKINIRARSADFRATLNISRELSYHQKTLSDIVRTVATRNNLKPEVDKTLADKQEEKQGDYLAGSEGNVLVMKHTYANKANAERAAKAEWEKIQRGVASFSLQLAKGRPELFPEMKVKVSGFKPEIDQANWTLVTVTHTLNDSGLTSALELEVKIYDTDMGA